MTRRLAMVLPCALGLACDPRPQRITADAAPPLPSATQVAAVPTPSASASAAPAADGTRQRAKDGATMLLVPAGPFLRGSPWTQGDTDEHPQREITLKAFWIDRTEVTMSAYRRCFDAGACSAPATEEAARGRIHASCNWSREGREDRPVNCVSWDQADTFCRWADVRLPSEAEWEKAARGNDGRVYPWGKAFPTCELAVWEDPRTGKACGTRYSCAVGSKPAGASPSGALDMAGNVWEWVADGYDAAYYGRAPDADPPGPEGAPFGVLRGGGYGHEGPEKLRTAERFRFDRRNQLAGIGFRCAD